mgnify:CR=1 FL=1
MKCRRCDIEGELANSWGYCSLGALPKTQKYVYPAYLNEIRHRLEDEKK